jgi:hypothetical protein
MSTANNPEVVLPKIQIMTGTEQVLLSFYLSAARRAAPQLEQELPNAWQAYRSPWSAFNRLTRIVLKSREHNLSAHVIGVDSKVVGLATAQKAVPNPNLVDMPSGVELSWWHRLDLDPRRARYVGDKVVAHLMEGAAREYGPDQTFWSVTLPADPLKPFVVGGAEFERIGDPAPYQLGDGAADQLSRQLWVRAPSA